MLRHEMSLAVIYKCICARVLSVWPERRSKKEESASQSNTAQISPPWGRKWVAPWQPCTAGERATKWP